MRDAAARRATAWRALTVSLLLLAPYALPAADGAVSWTPPDVIGAASRFADAALGGLAWAASAVLGFFVGSARAADRFLVMDDPGCTPANVSTDAGCWSTTSGGAGGASVPGASDDAYLDGNSGSGTVTQVSSITVMNFTAMGGKGHGGPGDFQGTWQTQGWGLTATDEMTLRGTFNFYWSTITAKFYDTNAVDVTVVWGTSTLVLLDGGDINTPLTSEYNLQIAASASVTSSGLFVRVRNVLTMGASSTFTIANNMVLQLSNYQALNTILIMGAGARILGGGSPGYAVFVWQMEAGSLAYVPGGNYTGMDFSYRSTVTVAGDGYEFRVTGDVVAWGFAFEPIGSGHAFFVNGQTYNVTLSGKILDASQLAPATLHGIKATSGTWTVDGEFNVSHANSTTFYMELGASTWLIGSNYINNVTTNAAHWSAGTSTARFGTPYPFIGQDIYPACQLGIPEFDHVLVDTRSNRTGTIVKLHGCLRAATVTVQTSVHTPFLNTTLNLTTGTVYTQNFTVGRDANWEGWHGSIYTCDWYTMQGFVESPQNSTVHFACSGRVLPNGHYYDYNFYNVVVEAGAVSNWSWMRLTGYNSFGEPICDAISGHYSIVGIANQLTVNGTITSGAPLGCFIYPTFLIQSRNTAWPILIGPSGNISSPGVVTVIELKNTAIRHFYLPKMYGYHISILDEVPDPQNLRIDMTGDIQTVDCIAEAHSPGYLGHVHEAYCAILLSHEQGPGPNNPGNYNLYSNGHKLMAGGSLWIGDFFGYGVIFHASNSIIAGRPATVIGGATAYFENATVYGYPATIWTPMAFQIEYYGTVHAGNATFWICGAFTTWAINTIFPGVIPPYVQRLYGENSTWHIQRNCAFTDPHPPPLPYHSGAAPGDVDIMQDVDYFDLGNSVWYVDGNWTSASTSPLWSAGHSSIYFLGNGNFRINGTAKTGQGVYVPGGTNNRFWKVYFMGHGTYTIQDRFSAGDVLVDTGETMSIAPGARYTVLIGSTILVRGHIYWNGNSTAQATITSNGTWMLQVYEDQDFQYLTAGWSKVQGVAGINVCNGGIDLGHNVQWNFPASGQCVVRMVAASLPPFVVALFIFTLLASGIAVIVQFIIRNEDFQDLMTLRRWERER